MAAGMLQQQQQEEQEDKLDELSVSQSVIFVLLAQLGRRFPREPKSFSLRLAFASISFGGFIVISLYR